MSPLLLLLPGGIAIARDTGKIEYGPVFDIGNIFFYLMVSIPCIIITARKIRKKTTHHIAFPFALLFLIFIPLLILEDNGFGFSMDKKIIGFFENSISILFPLFYLLFIALLYYKGISEGYLISSVHAAEQKTLNSSEIKKFNISERESEIIKFLARGFTNKQIGEKLFISPVTVRNHLYHIFQKTGVSNRTALVNLLYHPKARD